MNWKKKGLAAGMTLAIMLSGLAACSESEQDEMDNEMEEEMNEETDSDVIDEDKEEMEEEGQ
ncbi:hypothetical protein [Metabacillus indicus]|uniref:Lipoprotein n=1 Tax=Metabacillus indicus TaxID=246786 RepID=A0A084H4B3_METID|nr:hypothetical protein [Metabacillus indicus]KEZ50266.1 hypothetical protein AZ46_0206115 [Metabacillus indicus LMG 22858]KEZ54425.1 hypothetical protein GS18_0205795 [Metabacillus indicus]MDX8288556.1 hypothetical protein [Metabacillus indicus]